VTGTVLDRIVAQRREALLATRRAVSLEEIRHRAADTETTRDFYGALRRPPTEPLRLIAELKKASPSKGLIREDFDPVRIAGIYQTHGANAISVLTEEEHFQGSLSFLESVRKAVRLPLLRKDFIVDPYQVYEARAYGADAVLLIAAVCDNGLLRDLAGLARELDLGVLAEVHDEVELERVLAQDLPVVGINNRNLKTLSIDLAVSERLAGMIPADRIVVTESGINTRADVERFEHTRVNAMLVGTALMQSSDIGGKIGELLGRTAP